MREFQELTRSPVGPRQSRVRSLGWRPAFWKCPVSYFSVVALGELKRMVGILREQNKVKDLLAS